MKLQILCSYLRCRHYSQELKSSKGPGYWGEGGTISAFQVLRVERGAL